ncbi:MAG TPA: hypothetical protein DET40_25135 [Lentisphaeria bacterium]|nr:MAG: hypothetical protein A2X45_18825 [Lentisphaerae bacterium GWF2_50_93]HCE46845.1 hypothetical protein [Lentisphaeria bacterium]
MVRARKIVLVLSKFGGVTEVTYENPITIQKAESEIIDDSHYLWVLELTNGKKIRYVYGKKQRNTK